MHALTHPSLALAALLAATLLALAAPAEASARVVHSDCDHCPARPDMCSMADGAGTEMSGATLCPPADGSCCVLPSAVPRAAALAPLVTQTLQALAVVVLARTAERPSRRVTVRPLDTGPQPLGRRHLALSVLQI